MSDDEYEYVEEVIKKPSKKLANEDEEVPKTPPKRKVGRPKKGEETNAAKLKRMNEARILMKSMLKEDDEIKSILFDHIKETYYKNPPAPVPVKEELKEHDVVTKVIKKVPKVVQYVEEETETEPETVIVKKKKKKPKKKAKKVIVEEETETEAENIEGDEPVKQPPKPINQQQVVENITQQALQDILKKEKENIFLKQYKNQFSV